MNKTKNILQNKGLLITVEGIDGSGKTTFINGLHQYFINNNFPVTLTKEPGKTILGRELRALLEKPITLCHKAEFLLFAADRAQHFNDLIIPDLNAKKIIISDRMADSSLAYQGYGRGLDLEMLKKINSWVMQGIEPDIIFYLKINLDTALERINKRNETITNFEKKSLMQKVSAGYDEIFKNKNNVIVLDANLLPEEVLQKAINEFNLLFPHPEYIEG